MKNPVNLALASGRRILRRLAGVSPTPEFMRVAYCVPRQVVLVTTRHGDAENVWPIDWHMPLSLEPKLYGISVNQDSFGAELIRKSRVFVVNFVPASWEEVIFLCGRTCGRDVDKFTAAELCKEEAQSVDAPRLSEALGFLECRVEQSMEAGDHTLFVGRVTHEALRKDGLRLHHLHGGLASLAETFE